MSSSPAPGLALPVTDPALEARRVEEERAEEERIRQEVLAEIAADVPVDGKPRPWWRRVLRRSH